jgi:hypothetical protein
MENDKTLAEINRTVNENLNPIGSKIKVIKIGVVINDTRVHSIIIILL